MIRAARVCKKHCRVSRDSRDVGNESAHDSFHFMDHFILSNFFLKLFNLKSISGWLFHAFRQARCFEEHLVSANLLFDRMWSSGIRTWIVIDNHRNLSIVTRERPCRPLFENTMFNTGFCSDWIVRCLNPRNI